MSKKDTELHIGNGSFINIKSSQNVKLSEHFTIYDTDGPVTLYVDISADFAQVPEKYHEIFFNVISSKYLNKVAFGDNPFSVCKPVEKRKWYQFWRPKI